MRRSGPQAGSSPFLCPATPPPRRGLHSKHPLCSGGCKRKWLSLVNTGHSLWGTVVGGGDFSRKGVGVLGPPCSCLGQCVTCSCLGQCMRSPGHVCVTVCDTDGAELYPAGKGLRPGVCGVTAAPDQSPVWFSQTGNFSLQSLRWGIKRYCSGMAPSFF